jgi:hypothetical protein
MRTFAGSVVRLASIAEPGRPRPGHSNITQIHSDEKGGDNDEQASRHQATGPAGLHRLGTGRWRGSAAADELKVGVEIPLTGSLARVGSGMQEGINVAADVFNKTNGKHKIKLVTIDDESAPAKAIAAVEKLAGEGVLAITGGYGSNNIAPAADAAGKAGLVYMTSGGVDDNLVNSGRKNFFRINNVAGYQKAMVGLLDDMNARSVSIVYSTKEATAALAKDLEKAWGAKGLKVTSHAFDPAISDFKPIVNKIKLQDKPEVIAMIGYENDYVGILRAARVLKPAVKAMVGVWSLATRRWRRLPDWCPMCMARRCCRTRRSSPRLTASSLKKPIAASTRRTRTTWASSATCNRCCCSKPSPAPPTRVRSRRMAWPKKCARPTATP